jgi:hypothetical protein
MKKALHHLAGFAVAMPAIPADAARMRHAVCTKWRHGHCVKWKARRAAAYRVGYRFGPRYAYTPYRALPRTYVVRYDLNPRYRYVYSNDYIYVVDPATYAIQRVISTLTR